MNKLRNRVQLIGNLGADPRVNELDENRRVAHFSVATNERRKNKDGEYQDETTWHNVEAWTPLAEIAERFLHKGQEVALEGRIRYDRYETKEGEKRNATKIVCTDLVLLRNGKQEKNAVTS